MCNYSDTIRKCPVCHWQGMIFCEEGNEGPYDQDRFICLNCTNTENVED